MHGVINRSIQCFVRDSYGDEVWQSACQIADLGFDNFEAMLTYEDHLTEKTIAAVCKVLVRDHDELMEDLGTYLVAHPNLNAIRRLLRFGGESFEEFLHSIDDLPGRVRLALPDLDFPQLELHENGPGCYRMTFEWDKIGFGTVAVGVLRAMADDYGALVLLDFKRRADKKGEHVDISIDLLDMKFATGRAFSLQAQI